MNGSVSLNEAVYPEINLMANMLKLLLSFHTNQYVFFVFFSGGTPEGIPNDINIF